MRRTSMGTPWQILVALLATVVALPAWAGSPPRDLDRFANTAFVVQMDHQKHNPFLILAGVATYASPTTAMAQLKAWCGTPAADNPCLIKILPGIYDLDGGTLTMQPFVDIEGAGESTTVIKSEYSDSSLKGVVNGADNAELRFLTVKNATASGYGVAIANKSQSPRITHVTAIATGMYSYGIFNSAASPVLTHVRVTSTGGFSAMGVYNRDGSSSVMNDVTAIALNSNLGYGVCNDASSPVMTNVTASGKNDPNSGFEAYGVCNLNSSSPSMTNVSASAIGAHFSFGVFNETSTPVMNHVTAVASRGLNNYGVDNHDSSPLMTDVTAMGVGGTNSFGIRNLSSSPMTISADRSTFQGRISVENDVSNNAAMRIGGSKLIGDVGPNTTCIGSYNGDFVALGANCQR